jgi:N-acetylglucosaminyldiphosphoundecaprenol N-acetyl-beta-D-mannosaminyltransferase
VAGTAESWFLGVRFTLLSLSETLAALRARPDGAAFAYVTTPNAQHTVLYRRGGAGLRPLQDDAWLNLLDSRVLALLGRLLFGRRMKVTPGSDLTAALFSQAIGPDDPVTIIGGNAALADILRARFGLRRLALHVPPHGFIDDPAAVSACIAFVRAYPARLVFVACGFPRSEMLCRAMVADGGVVGTGLCVGSSLLFLAGTVRRAPLIWQRLHLEWLHRVVREPRRMVPRLFNEQLPVLALALRVRLGLGRHAG